jgi:hypothetical protein
LALLKSATGTTGKILIAKTGKTRARDLQALSIQSETEQVRNLSLEGTLNNTLASLGSVQTSAVVKPSDGNFGNWWRLAFRDKNSGLCQIGDLQVKGEVKILIDGNQEIFGVDESGKWFELDLVDYIPRNQRRDLLLI